MIAIVCRSSYLASTMSAMLCGERSMWFGTDDTMPDPRRRLSDALVKNRVSVVFYEPSFFVDPAPYRTMSPSTRFVVFVGPGEESSGRDALAFGAAAMLAKPVDTGAVNGVFQLVSV